MAAICEKDFALHVGSVSCDLMAYWTMDESVGGTGGPRVDEVSGIVLTPGGGPGGVSWNGGGKISNALYMVDITGIVSSQNTEPLLNYSGNGISFFGWLKCEFLIFGGGIGDLFNYKFIDSGGSVIGELDGKYNGDTTSFNCTLTGFGAPISITLVQDIMDSDYHFWVLWYDPIDKKIHLSVDNGSVTDSAGALASDIPDFQNGRLTFAYTGVTILQSFVIDEFGIYNGVANSSQRTALYNSDNGVTWPESVTICKPVLLGYWTMDEAAGTKFDSTHRNFDLDELDGSIGSTSGIISNAVEVGLVTQSSFLSATSYFTDLNLPPDTSITMALWFKAVETGATSGVYFIGELGFKNAPVGTLFTTFVFTLDWNTNHFGARFFSQPPLLQVSLDSDVIPAEGQWYFLVLWFDSDAQTFNMQVNDGTVFSASAAGVPVLTNDRGLPFFGNGSVSTSFAYDEAGVWYGVLSAAQRTALYNGGAGLTWPSVNNI